MSRLRIVKISRWLTWKSLLLLWKSLAMLQDSCTTRFFTSRYSPLYHLWGIVCCDIYTPSSIVEHFDAVFSTSKIRNNNIMELKEVDFWIWINEKENLRINIDSFLYHNTLIAVTLLSWRAGLASLFFCAPGTDPTLEFFFFFLNSMVIFVSSNCVLAWLTQLCYIQREIRSSEKMHDQAS